MLKKLIFVTVIGLVVFDLSSKRSRSNILWFI